MSEHRPYTLASASIDEHGARLSVSFNTPHLSVMVLGAERKRPFLSLSSPEARVSISTMGSGPVTQQDVTLAQDIASAAARYLTDCEHLLAERSIAPMLPGLNQDSAA
ncbi:hypothetical protein [Streptosporangium sp. 'caverna']|uniref:hypothetical protein n=1 Tax=Streptosporangium sp. 'caverna' TaxID=2202249 RepID=UPI000D7DA246|nr:hypothetical protein [Streptosporangium sp. 'caverna']AWS42948.1 hypothetical protein DKM19_17810 [Streptosporangium sp. 'caverna']